MSRFRGLRLQGRKLESETHELQWRHDHLSAKALKELITRVEDLETRLAVLETS